MKNMGIGRVLASFVSVVALLVAGMVVMAGPASAHHTTVWGKAVCNKTTGKWDGVWYIKNSENDKSADYTSSRGFSGHLNPGGTNTHTESFNSNPDGVSLTVSAKWSNGVKQTNKGYMDAPRGDCKKNPPQPPKDKEQRNVTNPPNCDDKTVTTLHQERSRSYVWDGDSWEPGPWSDWVTVSETVRDATVRECPPPPLPPCDDVCKLPKYPDSKGNVSCDGALNGGVYNNIRVRRGDNCLLVDVHVNGSVRAIGARSLRIHDSVIVGNVIAKRVSGDVYLGSKQTCRYDPKVGGSVIVKNSHNVLICQMEVCKKIVVKNNDGKITVRDSKTRTLRVQGNKRFVRDNGDRNHPRLSVIRLIDNKAKRLIVKNNKPRKVQVRR